MRTRGNDAPESPLIGVVAGEASGDALGAQLIAAVRRSYPNARFVGIGGAGMEAAGCESWYPMSKLSLRGYVEVLAHIPELWRIRRELYRRFREDRVVLFVGIDAPDFNLALEARLKRAGTRVIHYVSPSVWAWRRERIQTLARSADRLLALFPFESTLYAGTGLTVSFVGHPLAAEAAAASTRGRTRERLHLEPSTPLFALLPGSRPSELEMHSALLLDTAARIVKAYPDSRFLVPLATRETRALFEREMYRPGRETLPIKILYGHAGEALRAADLGVVASGTATLEAAMARCPHIIFYRVSRLTARIVMRKLELPYVGLPNVVAKRFVVAEFLQDDATAANLSSAAINLFDDLITRRRLEALFAAMARDLQAPTAALVAQAVDAELLAARRGMRA